MEAKWHRSAAPRTAMNNTMGFPPYPHSLPMRFEVSVAALPTVKTPVSWPKGCSCTAAQHVVEEASVPVPWFGYCCTVISHRRITRMDLMIASILVVKVAFKDSAYHSGCMNAAVPEPSCCASCVPLTCIAPVKAVRRSRGTGGASALTVTKDTRMRDGTPTYWQETRGGLTAIDLERVAAWIWLLEYVERQRGQWCICSPPLLPLLPSPIRSRQDKLRK